MFKDNCKQRHLHCTVCTSYSLVLGLILALFLVKGRFLEQNSAGQCIPKKPTVLLLGTL